MSKGHIKGSYQRVISKGIFDKKIKIVLPAAGGTYSSDFFIDAMDEGKKQTINKNGDLQIHIILNNRWNWKKHTLYTEMYLDSLQIKGQGVTGNLPLHCSLLNRQKGVHIPTLKYQIEKYHESDLLDYIRSVPGPCSATDDCVNEFKIIENTNLVTSKVVITDSQL